MIIGFTGTQQGLSFEQRETLADVLENSDFDIAMHGDCIGADRDFHDIVRNLDFDVKVVVFPSNIEGKRAFCDADSVMDSADPLVRNAAIAQLCDTLIACPKEFSEVLRSGTWATVRYAMKAQKTIVLILPDGVPILCVAAEPIAASIARQARLN